ncbi:MAG: MATE family efflux transporter [Alphaproteobacteria bacterium]
MSPHRKTLLEGNVPPHVLRLAFPLALGMFALNAFSLVDTWFISQLGTRYLAALGFCIPIIMLYMGVIFGLNVGTSAALARVYGEGDMEKFSRMATDALTLGAVVITAAAALGFMLIVPIFRLLGAGDALMPLIWKYMAIWYCGLPFLGMMMIGNACIRATGDTRFPSAMMISLSVLNMALDPFLIFGWGPFPRLELAGAAVTMVISSYIMAVISMWFLIFRKRVLVAPVWHRDIFASWKRIMHVAIPSMISNQISPISAAIITAMAAGFGKEAVAALGVATRIESMSTLVFYSLGAGLSIFAGQNFGAGNYGRIYEAVRAASKYALYWGAFIAAALWLAAYRIPLFFDDNETVVAYTAKYLHWVPLTYFSLGVMVVYNAKLNAIGRPFRATALILLKAIVLYVPLAWYFQGKMGFEGILLSLVITNLAVGVIAVLWNRRVLG